MTTIKKVLLAVGVALGLVVIANAAPSSTPNTSTESITPTIQATYSVLVTPSVTPVYVSPTPTATQSGLSNDNYYTNVSGNEVHSPVYSNQVPVGASAQCGDGTYSFSQHRQGTCSRHGGVAEWL